MFIDSAKGEVGFIIVPVLSQGDSDSHQEFINKNYNFISTVLGNWDHFDDKRLRDLHAMCSALREYDDDMVRRRAWLENLYIYKNFLCL